MVLLEAGRVCCRGVSGEEAGSIVRGLRAQGALNVCTERTVCNSAGQMICLGHDGRLEWEREAAAA